MLQNILKNYPQLNQQWQQAVDEIQGNPRLRLSLWFALGILLFYIGMLIGEHRTVIEKQLIQAKVGEVKAIRLATETEWIQRSNQAQQSLAQLQLKFNHASTQGAAKATLQGLMNKLVEQSGLENSNIRITATESEVQPLPLWSFLISINTSFNATKVENFLYRLSNNPHHLLVESLNINADSKTMSLVMRYWFANSADVAELEKIKQLTQTNEPISPSNKVEAATKQKINNDDQDALKKGFPDEVFN